MIKMTRKVLHDRIKALDINQDPFIFNAFKNNGKDVKLLFLPPYHCEFNPIEFSWSRVKPTLREREFERSVEAVTAELIKIFRECDQHWSNRVEHCEKLMEERRRVSEEVEETSESGLDESSDMDISDVFDVTDSESDDSDSDLDQ